MTMPRDVVYFQSLARNILDWVSMLSNWTNETVDRRIKQLREALVSYGKIARILRDERGIEVTKNQVIRRGRTLNVATVGSPLYGQPEVVPLTPCAEVPAWLSPEADALFAADWQRGCRVMDLCRRFQTSDDSITRRRAKLDLSPRSGGPIRPTEPVATLPPLSSQEEQVTALPIALGSFTPFSVPQRGDPPPRPTVPPIKMAYIPASRRCQFPSWANHERPTHVYCDKPVAVRSYCLDHAQIAYHRVPRYDTA
jgi:hypothetical protein